MIKREVGSISALARRINDIELGAISAGMREINAIEEELEQKSNIKVDSDAEKEKKVELDSEDLEDITNFYIHGNNLNQNNRAGDFER